MPHHLSSRLLSLLKHLLIATLCAAALFTLDYLYIQLVRPDLIDRFTGWKATDAFWFVFGLMLAATYAPKRLVLILFGSLALIHTSEFGYLSYFGVFFGPYDIWALFFELEDTFKVVVAEPARILPFALATGVLWGLVLYLLGLPKRPANGWVSGIIMTLLFSVPAIQLYGTNKDYFRPSYSYHSLHNSLFTLNYFLAGVLPEQLIKKKGKEYAPYELLSSNIDPVNTVVLIVGESVNPAQLQITGAEVETTPYLQVMKDRGEIETGYAVSSATTTQIASGMLLNVIYEPDNPAQYISRETNLFRLAHQQGYRTHYITTQKTQSMSYYYYDSSIDTYLDYDSMQERKTHGDRRILETIKALKLDYHQKNFLVLQHRNAHIPYVDNYPAEYERFKPANNSFRETSLAQYRNSLLYFDYTMAELINYLKDQVPGQVALFYVSDHSELMGEDGLYGHRTLTPAIARVPFISYTKGIDDEVKQQLYYRSECLPTHFNVARSVAQLLGINIHDPNYQAGITYTNSLDINGSQGFLTLNLAKDLKDYGCVPNNVAQQPADVEPKQ